MLNARVNFVVGVVPGLSGAVGKTGLVVKAEGGDYAKEGFDPLHKWVYAAAQAYPPQASGQFAGQNLALHYASRRNEWQYVLNAFLQKHGGVIVTILDGEVTVYSHGSTSKSAPPRRNVPRQMIDELAAAGVTSATPVILIRSALSGEMLPADKDIVAGQVLPGLPDPSVEATVENLADRIVSRLTSC